jgi:hypothetical protein
MTRENTSRKVYVCMLGVLWRRRGGGGIMDVWRLTYLRQLGIVFFQSENRPAHGSQLLPHGLRGNLAACRLAHALLPPLIQHQQAEDGMHGRRRGTVAELAGEQGTPGHSSPLI